MIKMKIVYFSAYSLMYVVECLECVRKGLHAFCRVPSKLAFFLIVSVFGSWF